MIRFEEAQTLIQEKISKVTFHKPPYELYEPLSYILSLGGKRLRPSLLLMSYSLYRKDVQQVLSYALGIELFHNFTLIHDDIMDDASLRRNQPTVFKKWGLNNALLSGDAMLIESYKYFTGNSKLLDVFNSTAIHVCEGQQYDINFENTDHVSESEYLKMIGLKTAALLGGALKMGAIAGGAPDTEANHLYQFGWHIGMGFQLQDDLIDTYGDSETFGKPIGGDIVANKKTFLIIKALELASPEVQEQLLSLMAGSEIPNNRKIREVKAILNQLDIYDITNTYIEHYFSQGDEALKALSLKDREYQPFRDFVNTYLYKRKR